MLLLQLLAELLGWYQHNAGLIDAPVVVIKRVPAVILKNK
jgi:hypothetical protein